MALRRPYSWGGDHAEKLRARRDRGAGSLSRRLEARQLAMLPRFILALAASIAAGAVWAQGAYPAKPVQVIIAFQPGGSVDVMARHLLNAMSALLGQPFVVLNRDGASGSVGFGQLASSKPDGYTLGAGPTTPIAMGPHLMKDIKYGVDSFEYICQSFENVFTVSVRPESPFRTMDDLIAAARANPGKLQYGHSGNGTVP